MKGAFQDKALLTSSTWGSWSPGLQAYILHLWVQTNVLCSNTRTHAPCVCILSQEYTSEHAIATRHKILKSNPSQSQATVVHLDLPENMLTGLTSGLTEEACSTVHQICLFFLLTPMHLSTLCWRMWSFWWQHVSEKSSQWETNLCWNAPCTALTAPVLSVNCIKHTLLKRCPEIFMAPHLTKLLWEVSLTFQYWKGATEAQK